MPPYLFLAHVPETTTVLKAAQSWHLAPSVLQTVAEYAGARLIEAIAETTTDDAEGAEELSALKRFLL